MTASYRGLTTAVLLSAGIILAGCGGDSEADSKAATQGNNSPSSSSAAPETIQKGGDDQLGEDGLPKVARNTSYWVYHFEPVDRAAREEYSDMSQDRSAFNIYHKKRTWAEPALEVVSSGSCNCADLFAESGKSAVFMKDRADQYPSDDQAKALKLLEDQLQVTLDNTNYSDRVFEKLTPAITVSYSEEEGGYILPDGLVSSTERVERPRAFNGSKVQHGFVYKGGFDKITVEDQDVRAKIDSTIEAGSLSLAVYGYVESLSGRKPGSIKHDRFVQIKPQLIDMVDVRTGETLYSVEL